MFFKMAVDVAILDLEVKMTLKHKKSHFIMSLMPELVRIDILFAILSNLVQEICCTMYFQDGVGGHLGFRGQDDYKLLNKSFFHVSNTKVSRN